MKPLVTSIMAIALLLLPALPAQAQFHMGPHFGVNMMGVNGRFVEMLNNRQTNARGIDASSTGFTFGLVLGFQVIPQSRADVQYQLDIDLDASATIAGLYEEAAKKAYNQSFDQLGLSGGGTWVWSIEFIPLHRLSFSGFRLLSPFVGVGPGFNIVRTADVSENTGRTFAGESDSQFGLVITYGTFFAVTDLIQPYLQLKHTIPFGDSMQFTGDLSDGQTTTPYSETIADTPGFFIINAGIRFTF